MFKVGDIVTLKPSVLNLRKTKKVYRYEIGAFRELQGTIMVGSINEEYSVEVYPEDMVLDVDYMRKMKLAKICSRLVT